MFGESNINSPNLPMFSTANVLRYTISERTYNTFNITIINTVLNKIIQIAMLMAYLYFLYKINAENEYTQRQYSKQLLMVAISMGVI